MKESDLVKIRMAKAERYSRMFIKVLFVRAILLNGSLAQGKAEDTSDIDLLIIARKGRLFTARFLIVFLGMILGVKRSSDPKNDHSGKFCFNYFMADDYLEIPTGRGEKMDGYCRENYSASVLLAGDREVFEKFMKVNGYSKISNSEFLISNQAPSPKSQITSTKLLERLLAGTLGAILESVLKRFQIWLINRDERTAKYPDLIVVNDREMRFHPPR